MSLTPLYLAAGHAWHVRLDDTGLRVAGARRAGRHYPFARLSRVLSANDAEWATDALLGCLDAGVPVQFIDAHGHVKAYCYGTRQREATLAGLLQAAIDHPDWDGRFAMWHHGVATQAMRLVLDATGLQVRHPDTRSVRRALRNAHRTRLGAPLEPLLEQLEGATHTLVAARLQEAVADQWLLGHPRPGLCLVREFGALMQWPTLGLLRATTANELATLAPARLAAQLVEAQRNELLNTLDHWLERFALWLREWSQ